MPFDILRTVLDSQLETFNGTKVDPANQESPGGDQGFYLDPPNNATHLGPASNQVRQQFEGLVNFYFNDSLEETVSKDFANGLSSLVKTAEFPSFELQTDTHNQYNKKRVTVSGVEYKPISVTVYDTIDSAWVIMLMRAYQHLFLNPMGKFEAQADGSTIPKVVPYDVVPDKLVTGSGDSGTMSGFTQVWNESSHGLNLNPGELKNFLSHMDFLAYHGQKYVRYTIFNPLITSFKIDSIDYASSQPITIQMEISYESFSMDPVINNYIPEDDMKRWVNFSDGLWSRLREGSDDIGANIPGGNGMNGKLATDNPSLNMKSAKFLAPVGSGGESSSLRTEQNQEFWNNFNPG